MHWRLFLTLAALLAAWPEAGRGDPSSTSQATATPPQLGLFGTVATIAPYLGTLGYADGNNNYTVRGLIGVTGDLFLAALDHNDPPNNSGSVLYGLETGIFYTNLDRTSHAELVPIVFKGIRQLGPRWFIDATLGAELIHREASNAMTFGRTHDSKPGDSIDVFPNAGVNLAWKAGPWVALSLRADYIPTPGQDLFTTTLGGVFPVG